MTPPLPDVCLGKHLGVVHDPRTLKAATILNRPAIKYPREHKVGGTLSSVPVFANDRLGDCTQASIGHAIVTMERSSSQKELPVTEDQIIFAYQRVGGYVPGDDSTDNGAYELDSLNNWRKNGIGAEKDYTAHKIYAFSAVNWKDHVEVMASHYVFGGLKVCAGLPLTAADQLRRGDSWSIESGPRSSFGSWGGHSMYSFAYDRNGLWVWTWGRPQLMTWEWIDKYVDEVYAVISEDYIRRSGSTPQGFKKDVLDAYLAAL